MNLQAQILTKILVINHYFYVIDFLSAEAFLFLCIFTWNKIRICIIRTVFVIYFENKKNITENYVSHPDTFFPQNTVRTTEEKFWK